MFDNDDWYSGEVKGYDHNTARYHLVFEDGEEAACRHALFEPDDGFFLDNGKDCGMTFRDRVSTSLGAALKRGPVRASDGQENKASGALSATASSAGNQGAVALIDEGKCAWTFPLGKLKTGGAWLVGRRINVYWNGDRQWFAGYFCSRC